MRQRIHEITLRPIDQVELPPEQEEALHIPRAFYGSSSFRGRVVTG